MQNNTITVAALCAGLILSTTSFAQKAQADEWDDAGFSKTPPKAAPVTQDDFADYTEYLAGLPPHCEKPVLNTIRPGSSLDACEAMYQANNFVESTCESEALFKQKTAPALLQEADVKWLSNVVNRKR